MCVWKVISILYNIVLVCEKPTENKFFNRKKQCITLLFLTNYFLIQTDIYF